MRVICHKLDAFFFCTIWFLEKPVIEPSTSIQILRKLQLSDFVWQERIPIADHHRNVGYRSNTHDTS